MRERRARAYFAACLTLGRLLRSVRYSKAQIVYEPGDPSTGSGSSSRASSRDEPHVRKRRAFYAPLLIWMADPALRIMDTGVRVLHQREWVERERLVYERLCRKSIHVEADGTLVLPRLAGKTLATLLEVPGLEESVRAKAIELAVVALVELHESGFTHGDAMAENVLVDLAPRRGPGRPEHSPKGEAGIARWFDFETVHDLGRPMAWRRADDVRALLVTCLVRTVPDKRAGTLNLILDLCADVAMTRHLAATFASVFQRPLAFHLAQAGLSFGCYRDIGRLLRERLIGRGSL